MTHWPIILHATSYLLFSDSSVRWFSCNVSLHHPFSRYDAMKRTTLHLTLHQPSHVLVYSIFSRYSRNLPCKPTDPAIKSWYQRKVCSHYGLRCWLRSHDSHSTGQDGSLCVSGLLDKRRRTEFEIGDEQQTDDITDGCYKLEAD